MTGHLDCLRYAHENGAPWDEATCRYAALNGRADCLRYAYDNGAPLPNGVGLAQRQFVAAQVRYCHAVRRIQRQWRSYVDRRRRCAVAVIEAAVLEWLLRPGRTVYRAAARRWADRAHEQGRSETCTALSDARTASMRPS
jgi:hypothetical protein